MPNLLRVAASPLLIALLVAVPAHLAFGETTTTPVAASGGFAGLVNIGGRRLYLACKGSGTPTVILEAGAGNKWRHLERDRSQGRDEDFGV